jgi:hypothetical protein
MTTTIYCERGPSGAWISFAFNRQLVDIIKAVVPPRERSYHPEERSWWIDDPWVARLTSAVNRAMENSVAWVGIEPDCPPPRPKSPPPPINLETAFVNLFQSLPPALVRPMKVAILKVVHPDMGGDHASAVALNAALERVAQK